jgi:hypothetical protein
MRVLSPFLLPFLLAACAGQLADHVGPRASIVTPQLIRYGYDLVQTRCVGERLGASLRPRQLRLLARAAGAVQQGYFEPTRLGVRDLLWVAQTRGAAVREALEGANAACGAAVRVETPPTAPVTPAERLPAWLNLGAAPTGQAIAIDAATIGQEDGRRSAWFRLTDPGAEPSLDIFRLVVDCAARTINATGRRRLDATGAVVERRDYPDNPLPIEDDTVMQIAWLSLCT